MLTITPEAGQYLRDQGGIIYLEYHKLKGCCIPYQPGPAVRFGQPRHPEQCRLETIDGMTVFVPFELPNVSLQIILNTFMGFKRLVVDGWHHA
jgi:hypothetical protein